MGKLSNLPPLERPREKAIHYGIETLSDSELLSIILSSGYKGTSVKEISQKLLVDFGGLQGLAKASFIDLKSTKGIRDIKAIILFAAFEIHRRLSSPEFTETKQKASAEYLYNKYKYRFIDSPQEHLLIVLVNRRKEILGEKVVYIGTGTKISISFQDLFREAFKYGASGFYLIHNHPDGDFNPSAEDYFMTGEIINATKKVGIKLIDHIIIGENGYYSFENATNKQKK